MTRPLPSNAILCKDGASFFVDARGSGCVLFAEFRDEAIASSGLGKFGTFHEPGDPTAEYEGMPIEVVRAYARAHGGVAEAGAEAVETLKRLPTAAALAEAKQGAGEGAPVAMFPDVGGPDLAGRAEGGAVPGTLGQRDGGGPETLELDALTSEIIEARKVLACLDASFHPPGKIRSDQNPELMAWYHRANSGAAYASRLVIVTQPRHARHPLLQEGIALRARLHAIADEARRELPAAQSRALGIKINAA